MAGRVLTSDYFVLYLTIVYVLCLTPWIPYFWSRGNFVDILSNTWPLLVIAVGQTFVLIVGGIDLAQTAVLALVSIVGAALICTELEPYIFEKCVMWGWLVTEDGGLLAHSAAGLVPAILAMLACGLFVGFINGVSVACFKMPAFMVTLVTMMLFSAVALYLSGSENIMHLPEGFVMLGLAYDVVSIPMGIALAVTLLAHILLRSTCFGAQVYAVGVNPMASRISGIPVRKVLVAVFMISGLCAAIGSILYTARMEMGRPTLGATMLLDVVGANVIGGVSLSGGKGKIIGTVLGALFFVILANTLSFLNLSFYTIDLAKGAVIFGAAALDVVRTRITQRT
ncbi:MAG: ABC transporter permease, partial [Planctomycetota bacterium]|jgi:ribose/xylose/arabinose/galactoside ABC-type transport system permease subunit|nr:ABC transporter permease [Planctomycetota bacterium]